MVDQVYFESKAEAAARLRELYKAKPTVLGQSGPVMLPDSFRVRLDAPEHFEQLQRALCPRAPSKGEKYAPCTEVTYESPEQAYRRLPEKLRRDGRDLGKMTPRYTPESLLGAFHLTLDKPARAGAFHQALCGSRQTGACAGGLVVVEHARS